MEINIAIIGLILSFFFAGSEAAYTAFNKVLLEAWDRQGNKLARIAKQFLTQPEDFFSTILIGNNLANILFTTFGTVLLIVYMDETVAGIVLTLTVVFFGEILPKTIFRSLADKNGFLGGKAWGQMGFVLRLLNLNILCGPFVK